MSCRATRGMVGRTPALIDEPERYGKADKSAFPAPLTREQRGQSTRGSGPRASKPENVLICCYRRRLGIRWGPPHRMLTLFHHPFCPHSRFVRLALGEYGLAARTVEERVWERRQEFLILNPACTTPGAAVIAEYLDETRGGELGELRLLPREVGTRVEVRRLMNWFNDKFFAEVSGPLTTERLYKRQMPTSAGGGSPDTEVIRAARHNMRYHLAYIGWLVRTRDWLAGGRMSYADLAAAAHLSAADYLGDVPWNEDEAAKTWYAQIKSRPSFRPILAETLAGIPPSETYADLDF